MTDGSASQIDFMPFLFRSRKIKFGPDKWRTAQCRQRRVRWFARHRRVDYLARCRRTDLLPVPANESLGGRRTFAFAIGDSHVRRHGDAPKWPVVDIGQFHAAHGLRYQRDAGADADEGGDFGEVVCDGLDGGFEARLPAGPQRVAVKADFRRLAWRDEGIVGQSGERIDGALDWWMLTRRHGGMWATIMVVADNYRVFSSPGIS